MSFVIAPSVASGVLVDTPDLKITEYETLTVNDEELKYKSLCESQEKHIQRQDEEIARLKEELSSVGDKLVDSVVFSQETSTTAPQGITLPSQFRNGLEAKLREKANQLKEAVK